MKRIFMTHNGKGKVVRVLNYEVIKHCAMKAYGGGGCIYPHFDLGTSWRWVVSFTPRPLYPRGKSPGTHWMGCWVDPRAGLDDLEKRKFLTLPWLELRPLRCPAVASRYTDYATPAPDIKWLKLKIRWRRDQPLNSSITIRQTHDMKCKKKG
jgi:hypothetical protein